MQELINNLYRSLVNDGCSLNSKNLLKKGSKTILPDNLKSHVATKDIDLAAKVNAENQTELYAGIAAKFSSILGSFETESKTREKIPLFDFLPDRYEVLNRNLFNFFRENLVYARDTAGNVIVLSREGRTGNVWKIVNDMHAGVMMHPDLVVFTKIHTLAMQSAKRGATYMVCNRDGSNFGIKSWPEVLDIAVRKAQKWLAEDDRSSDWMMPEESEIYKMKTNRLRDKQDDPTALPPIRQTCADGGNAYITSLWEADTELCVAMPETITNDPTVPAFCYVDLDSFTDGGTPEFDGFMTSVHPAVRDVFMACLYSTVYDKAHHSLVVWMHGEGNNGKSQFFSALNSYFGGTLTGAMTTKSLAGDFGLEDLIGKRLIIWGDCQNGNALSTNEVHGITGGDVMPVNRKGKAIINYKFNSMLFIGANRAPEIKMNAINETRRCLYVPMSDPAIEVMRKYCEFDQATGEILRQSTGQPIFKSYDLKGKLLAEMPHIMYKCQKQFEKYCKAPYNQMTVPPEAFELMVNKCEGGQNVVFTDFMATKITVTKDQNDFISAKDLSSEYLAHVYGENSRNLITKYSFELGDLKRYLTTSFKEVEFLRKSINGNKVSGYTGLKFGVSSPDPLKTMKSFNMSDFSAFSDEEARAFQ